MAVFLNDRFLENEKALLHVSDLSMQRGYAVFDFFRTVNGVPLFMTDHLDRFFNSASGLHLPVRKTREELSIIIHELIKRSSLAEAGIRVMLTGGNSADSYHAAEPNLLITCNPVKTATEQDFEKGISIISYEHQRELPHIKSINYLMGVWLQPLLKEKQVDDVLYYNKESITEFPRNNIFIVTPKDALVTPVKNILKGITRKHILSLAAEFMPVKERNITRDELMTASEVFLTSTTKKILPVVKIDGKIIRDGRPGKFTTLLDQKFLELEKKVATD
jgi:D-alanine transaminase/branched-chain amino acid aminotransferase